MEAEKSVIDRSLKAKKSVRNYMWWSMGAGLVPFPLVDMAAVTGVQLKMLADLSKLYDTPFKESLGRKLVISLFGSILPNGLAQGFFGSILKSLPVVGTVMGAISMSVFSGASTYAIGNIFIQHFETGGTLLDFNPSEMREYFRELFEEGKTVAEEMEKEKKEKK